MAKAKDIGLKSIQPKGTTRKPSTKKDPIILGGNDIKFAQTTTGRFKSGTSNLEDAPIPRQRFENRKKNPKRFDDKKYRKI